MAERLVVCGGLPAIPCDGAASLLELDVGGSASEVKHVNLKLGDLSTKMVQYLPAVLTDLIEIAAYVYSADQFTSRGGSVMRGMGQEWVRTFRFRIPVRELEIWRSPDIQRALVGTLGFLSDDDFTFEFVPHPDPASAELQTYLEYPELAGSSFEPDDVLLFSGGLDSFAGAVENLLGRGRKVALVSHRSSTMIASKQRHLIEALRDRTERGQLFHVPLSVNKGSEEAAEFTQRTRSFLFACIGLVVARMFGRDTVQFFENGVVSSNLPVASHVLGTRATRTTHPRVLVEFGRLFSLILGTQIAVENPFFWKTKADVIAVLAQHDCADLIVDTFSCTRVRQSTVHGRHCGVCSQCLDRRFGVLASGLGEYEPESNYKIDLLRGKRAPGEDVAMAGSYVLHAVALGEMTDHAFYGSFGQAQLLLPYLPGKPDDNARQLWELHRRHGQSVSSVLEGEIRRYTVSQLLDLPANSLLRLSQIGSLSAEQVNDPTELEAPISRQAKLLTEREIDRPIMMAIDVAYGQVLFDVGLMLDGADFRLLAALAELHRENKGSEPVLEAYKHLRAKRLAAILGVSEQTIRQNVTRLRKHLRIGFRELNAGKIDPDDVVQNSHSKGYRLNPYIVLTEPERLRNVVAAKQASQTTGMASQTSQATQ